MRCDNVVLKNFSLNLGEDKVVALVGRSGGGKAQLHIGEILRQRMAKYY